MYKSGIECITIVGWANNRINSVDLSSHPNHAWNAVYIKNKWQLIDVTWADNIQLDEFYYFTNPQELIKDHFPENEDYQFLDEIIDKEEYKFETPL